MPTPTAEQDYGIKWLASGHERLLADIQGYGKTLQAIEGAKLLGAQRVCVICPAVARVNWEREFIKNGWPHPITRVTDKADHALPHPHRPEAVIASYDGLAGSKRLRGALNAGGYDVLIADEAHRCKSAESKRSKSLYGVQMDCQRSLAGKAMYRWLLTANPFPNQIGELWTHLHALWPHLISNMVGKPISHDEFLERYCVVQKTEYGIKILGYRDRDGLASILDQIMLRRTEIKGLPSMVWREDPILLDIDNAELERLEQHEEFDELRSVLNSADARSNDLDAIEDEFIHLATLRRLTGLLKAKAVAELVNEDLGSGDKIILFALHREVIETLNTELQCFNPAVVHGGIADGARNAEIDRFNEDSTCRVFIGQIEATKECINLPAANRVLFVEMSWNPSTNEQCIARAWRRGNMRQVFAACAAIAGSIDELVGKCLALKIRNIHELMKGDFTHGH